MGMNAPLGRITIRSFQPSDQEAVKQLILDGLVEHWGFLDSTKNPDLKDIYTHYSGAVFLVAWSEDQIVGCGALVPRQPGTAEIVRMSVNRFYRKRGVGTRILNELLHKAKEMRIHNVILETTSTWHEVIAFYIRNGFHITHYQDGDAYFEYIL